MSGTIDPNGGPVSQVYEWKHLRIPAPEATEEQLGAFAKELTRIQGKEEGFCNAVMTFPGFLLLGKMIEFVQDTIPVRKIELPVFQRRDGNSGRRI